MTTSTGSQSPPRATLLFVLASALLGAMGIGLVGPVLPFLLRGFVPDPARLALAVGWLGACYGLCAFLAAPVLGALSDAFGRRPVLLVSLAGSAAGYLLFGLGGALWALFLGRAVDGLTAGNFGALFGMLADVTPPGERGRVFGQVGATVGAGFILGPALGGLLAPLGLQAPVLAAAGLTALSLLWGLFLVPESLAAERRTRAVHLTQLNPLTQLAALFALPGIRRLLVVAVLFTLAFSVMQATLSLLAKDALGWGPGQVSTAFITVGLCDIVAQGLLLGRLIRRFGERGVALGGLTGGVLGLSALGLLPTWPHPALLYLGVVLFATGEGVFTASLGALLSAAAGPEAQGRVQGGSQSLQSLSSVVGPLTGGQVYARAGEGVPFLAGAALSALAVGLLTRWRGGAAPRVGAAEAGEAG